MFKYVAILISIALVNGYPQSGPSHIENGKEVEITEVPYLVSIHGSMDRQCCGSILSAEWVLTTVQCVSTFWNDLSVRAGSSMFNANGSVHSKVEIIKHENYTEDFAGFTRNNIALIKVTPPFILDQKFLSAVQLADQDQKLQSNASCNVTGWGSTTGDGIVSNKLRKVEVKLITGADCWKEYMPFFFVPDKQLCSYDVSGKGPCDGDYGSPLMVKDRLAGIVVGGRGKCAESRYPAVYTEIAHYRRWIDSKMTKPDHQIFNKTML